MGSPAESDTTATLLGARSGEGTAAEERRRLFELLYEELRTVAAQLMRHERSGHTLTPTALIHELYIRLIDQTRVEWNDRAQFFAIAASAMRHILVEHARAKNAAKRGGGWRQVTLEAGAIGGTDGLVDAIALSDTFEALAKADARSASVAEMRVFAGLTHTEIAEVLGVSRRTVDADWAFARRWLSRELGKR